MNPAKLTEEEIYALSALVAHLICANNKIERGEAWEMVRLAKEAGIPGLNDSIANSLNRFPKPSDAIANAVGHITRPDAREMVITILNDFASSDGLRERCETQIIEDLERAWGG